MAEDTDTGAQATICVISELTVEDEEDEDVSHKKSLVAAATVNKPHNLQPQVLLPWPF